MKEPEKLRELADWFDSNYPPIHSPAHVKEVQSDLRRIADNLEKMEPEPTPKKYVYFVSYYGMRGSKGGHGNGEMTADRAVKSWADMEVLSNTIKFDNNLDKVVILNYQLLRTE